MSPSPSTIEAMMSAYFTYEGHAAAQPAQPAQEATAAAAAAAAQPAQAARQEKKGGRKKMDKVKGSKVEKKAFAFSVTPQKRRRARLASGVLTLDS